MTTSQQPPGHIVLTSHPRGRGQKLRAIDWGAATPAARGPIVGALTEPQRRNVIGAHNGSYGFFRALAVAAGTLDATHKPDLADTHPAVPIGPHPQWTEPDKIVSLDPWGHVAAEVFAEDIRAGLDIRPTIAVTKAYLHLPELKDALEAGRLAADGRILKASGEAACTKIAVEPVWHLPSVAARFGIDENHLRRTLFSHSGGMFPELVTRDDLHVFLPPIGGRKTWRSSRVTSSGNMPPEWLKSVRRRWFSSMPKRAATLGRCQTGSTAILVQAASPLALRMRPSAASRPASRASLSSGRWR